MNRKEEKPKLTIEIDKVKKTRIIKITDAGYSNIAEKDINVKMKHYKVTKRGLEEIRGKEQTND